MGHGKETPRQKMIGMMYLVLTALLAMNVSKDVLDAFVIVDKGLVQTTENFAAKNAGIYSTFDLAHELNPEKVGDWKNKITNSHLEIFKKHGFEELLVEFGYGKIEYFDEKKYTPIQKKIEQHIKKGEPYQHNLD